jgi:hypothetical protein
MKEKAFNIPFHTFNDDSVVFFSGESKAYNQRRVSKVTKYQPFSEIKKDELLSAVHSKIQAPPKKSSSKLRRDTLKDVSKGALYLLKQKSILLNHIFETEEKKHELTKRVGKRRNSLELGYASGLLLETKTQSNIKLSLSRRKTRLEQFLHTQYLFNCRVQALLAMVTIFTSIIEYENTVISIGDEILNTFNSYQAEYNIDEKKYKRMERVSHICSYLTFILSVFLWISIYYDKTLNKILREGLQEKSLKMIFGTWKEVVEFILNILIFFFCPNPFTYKIEIKFHNNEKLLDYKIPINSIFTSICLFRIWFIFKLFLVSSVSYTQRSFRICKINGVELDLNFPFKANMTDSALTVNLYLFLMCLIVCSYDLRIFERYFDRNDETSLDNYLNNIWCVFITMTTVGYGDIIPVSFLGRVIIIISCMFGVFLMGLMVVSVTSYLNIVGVESNIYKILLKSRKMEERNKLAFKAIAQYLKSIKKVNRKKLIVSKEDFLNKIVPNEKKNINKYLNDFKIADLDFLSTIPALNEFDNIGDHLRFLEENMNKNQDKVVEIVDLLDQLNSVFHNA